MRPAWLVPSIGCSILLGVTLAPDTWAQAPIEPGSAFSPNWKPTLDVRPAEGSIRVDGELDDPGWRNVARAVNFAEVDPGDQVEPRWQSEAWVTYDSENLYVALIAYDDPNAVRVSLRERDNIFRDDYFGIMLDTYGDLAWGYELFVNPLGIQGDLRVMSDGNEDISFDIVWHSKGRVTETGYQVEIAVPFASLRFAKQDEQVWRVNFWRDQQRDVRRRFAWGAIDRDNSCWMCNWGTLTGVRGIKPGTNLDILPAAVATQAGQISDFDDPDAGFTDESVNTNFSINVRYGVTSNSSAEVTYNPDFSQIESDAGQIDANTTFALFFPERRPFFQEGSNLYNTWIDAIYTRSINDPRSAAKFTGQFGRTGALYLYGEDELSPIIIPTEDRSYFVEGERSFTNIARVRQTYASDSHIGWLITDRRHTWSAGGAGSVAAFDGRQRFTSTLQLEYQLAGSRTVEPNDTTLTEELNDVPLDDRYTLGFDGERYYGYGAYVSLERNGRRFSSDVDYRGYSPTFRTENGFTTRVDFHQVSWWNGIFFRPNTKLLVTWQPWVSVGRIWNFDGRFEDEWVRPGLDFTLIGQTNVSFMWLESRERFAGIVIPEIRRRTVSVSTRPVELFSVGVSVTEGQTIRRNPDIPELADGFDGSVWGSLRLGPRLLVDLNYDYLRLDRRDGVDGVDDDGIGPGENIYEGYIGRARFNYQFTREFFLRLVAQYNSFSERFDVEPLLTYRANPFTVFFLGSTSQFHNLSVEHETNPDLSRTDWELTDRQFFAKLQYLFRL